MMQSGALPTTSAGSILAGLTTRVDLTDRVIPLWLNLPRTGLALPTTRIGDEVLTAETVGWCAGKWSLHLFSFASEAREAGKTLVAAGYSDICEPGVRTSGEGLLLIRREADGPFECTILDRRRVKDPKPVLGSWQTTADIALRAALHVPCRAAQRAEALLRHVEAEFDDQSARARVIECLGGSLNRQTLASIRLDDVVEAANRLLDPVGAEISCSDRRIAALADALLAKLEPELAGLVERLAIDLIGDLAESGCIG